jgi:hypothetical protein
MNLDEEEYMYDSLKYMEEQFKQQNLHDKVKLRALTPNV